MLLTALLDCVSRWTGQSTLLVDVESHGREEDVFDDVDLSRTVGWFTTYYPLPLTADLDASLKQSLLDVKQQVRAIPERGFHYGLLRYLHTGVKVGEQLRDMPRAEINFNYLGQFGQVVDGTSMFQLVSNDTAYGLDRSPRGLRSHLLDVVGWVVEDRLQVDWFYSENAHRQSTIEQLASDFLVALRQLIEECDLATSDATSGTAVDDFDWNASELAEIEAAIARVQKAD